MEKERKVEEQNIDPVLEYCAGEVGGLMGC
jgi:hypothetical protein